MPYGIANYDAEIACIVEIYNDETNKFELISGNCSCIIGLPDSYDDDEDYYRSICIINHNLDIEYIKCYLGPYFGYFAKQNPILKIKTGQHHTIVCESSIQSRSIILCLQYEFSTFITRQHQIVPNSRYAKITFKSDMDFVWMHIELHNLWYLHSHMTETIERELLQLLQFYKHPTESAC
jgi:hypothetical protein